MKMEWQEKQFINAYTSEIRFYYMAYANTASINTERRNRSAIPFMMRDVKKGESREQIFILNPILVIFLI